MKKYRILLFFIAFTTALLAQKKQQFLAKRDFVISDDSWGSVYITQDRNCSLYNQLCPTFNPDKMHSLCVGADTIQFNTFPVNVERYWADLFLYKKQFYVYAPSNWMNNTLIYIADSVLFDMSENFFFYPILESNQLSNGQSFSFNYLGEKTCVTIIPLKNVPGAAVWKIETKKSKLYKLKVTSSAVKNFPLIINDCFEQKCLSEFPFEEPDFEKLLKDNEY